MAQRTITRLYETYSEASSVVTALEQAGIPHADISLVGHQQDTAAHGVAPGTHGKPATTGTEPETAAGAGASVGTLVGGGVGLLAGIGALAIPGVGPVIAAGWLVATLTGAGVGAVVGGGAGGLVGSLTHAGVDEHEANLYAEGVRRGGNLVTVRTDEAMLPAVETILNHHPGVDTATRRGQYEAEGWQRYDEKAGPYVGGTTQR